jgi:hypothetical protein
MKTTALLTAGLLATTAMAAPLTAKRQELYSTFLVPLRARTSLVPGLKGGLLWRFVERLARAAWRSNWAGAVLIGTGYTAVTAEFVVPTPSVPSGGSSREEYCASAWVGIDGDTCDTAILQSGVAAGIDGDLDGITGRDGDAAEVVRVVGVPLVPGIEAHLAALDTKVHHRYCHD